MNSKPLAFPPNIPITLKLQDPQRDAATLYDFDLRIGRYLTTDGYMLELPRPAAIQLNTLDPQPGEEITVVRKWSGKQGESPEWVIGLTAASERARAGAETPSELTEMLQASLDSLQDPKADLEPPTPIRKTVKAEKHIEQPKLFDLGTGTNGPALRPRAVQALARWQKPGVIPFNVAFREVTRFVVIELEAAREQWNDEARQAMVSTILIAGSKSGYIGPWEREG